MGFVFISHSRDDRAYVDKLAEHLEGAGVSVWYDYQLITGQRWSNAIVSRIEQCAAMIVVMSPSSMASDMVENEIDLARELGKDILPLLLGERPLFGLRHLQFTDVRGGVLPDAGFLTLLRQLAPTAAGTRPPAPRPPIKLDDDFLAELGLAALPEPERRKLLQHIYETLEMRTGMKLAERMSDEQLTQFEAFVDRDDQDGALAWLEANMSDYRDVVYQTFVQLRDEVKAVAPQILQAARGQSS